MTVSLIVLIAAAVAVAPRSGDEASGTATNGGSTTEVVLDVSGSVGGVSSSVSGKTLSRLARNGGSVV
ncbi:MAG TPA: hypothetical protein VH816_05630 [Gaiellaceae bacterium]